ncbi:MAG TPA: bifunctional glutamate N-acetyltransferase/amino-acid acetyltransferase ArgJ [Candidatus Acidoferrales bacterium]|nr:bifunctional glutamate N-acetyltransferase/amino-acid acetyltransferase ArgJ [Candidatus Acidoferrales bacterium]
MSAPKGSSQIPRGFSFAAAHCGIRKRRLDLGLIVAERPAAAAGMFTRNRVQAAPVIVSRRHLAATKGRARAVVVNSGNANCATGAAGLATARKTAAALARELGCRPEEILVCSTGVIGMALPAEPIVGALPAMVRSREAETETFNGFAQAIMTTDTRRKQARATCQIAGRTVRLLGCAKGAGMIHPQLATMLAFVLTDVAARPTLLARALARAVARTFNSISVDGDTSTNDTVLLLASGAARARPLKSGSADERRFAAALEKVCGELALAIVADGEGAEHVIELEVRGAPSDAAARRVAETIATSPLVKTALAGADPNWGRILAAAGRAGVEFDQSRAAVWLAGRLVCRRGAPVPFKETSVHRRMLEKRVDLAIDLGAGSGRARMLTCDFTEEYVRINASYRT